MEAEFNPMAEEQIKPQRKNKIKFICCGIVAFVVLLFVVLFLLFKVGVLLSANDKILYATYNTFKDKTELVKTFDISNILESGKYTIAVNGGADNNSVDCSYLANQNAHQLKGNASISGTPNIDFDFVVSDGKLSAYTSYASDYLYIYDYGRENTGYLLKNYDQQTIDRFNYALKQIDDSGNDENSDTSTIYKTILKHFRKLKFDSVDSKKFKINESNCSCRGYSTYIDQQDARNFISDLKELISSNTEKNAIFTALDNKIETFSGTYLTVYIYKNKLACISVKMDSATTEILFHGGRTRWQNMEVLRDGASILGLTGSEEGDNENYNVTVNGADSRLLCYDKKSGELSIKSEDFNLTATVRNTKKGFSLELDDLNGIHGNINISKGAEIDKPTADKTFDIGNASKSEVQVMLFEIIANNPTVSGFLGGLL